MTMNLMMKQARNLKPLDVVIGMDGQLLKIESIGKGTMRGWLMLNFKGGEWAQVRTMALLKVKNK